MSHNSLGVYLSVPFCKAKCSFCNFASGVFAAGLLDQYVEHLCAEISEAHRTAEDLGCILPRHVDTIYFGGGTPSLLHTSHLRTIFAALEQQFTLDPTAEITLEAAPSQFSEETLTAAMRCGVNRVSFGVQSFVDKELTAVGRPQSGAECLAEVQRLRAAGVPRIGLDLIAGLPHQTEESWRFSVEQAIASGVDHVSIYLLEIDEDSRLGRERLAGGDRYYAGALPVEDDTAGWYLTACERLDMAGLPQYEISNFARPGFASRHNLKYWRRSPYIGFGLDAHSMLYSAGDPEVACRWANPEEMADYLQTNRRAGVLSDLHVLTSASRELDIIDAGQAFEESLFLGLRLNEGVDLKALRLRFGDRRLDAAQATLCEVETAGLVQREATRWRLTPSGRLASNEVFGRLLAA